MSAGIIATTSKTSTNDPNTTKEVDIAKMITKMIAHDTNWHQYVRKKCIDAIMDRRFCKETRAMLHEIVVEIERREHEPIDESC